MTSATLVTADQYLNMHFENLEPELVRGELVERTMPNSIHAWLTHLLSMRLHGAGFCLIGVRCRLSEDVIRIPDLAVFRTFPERVPSLPPLLVTEIASPEDRYLEVLGKLEDYRIWGVEHIWTIQPELKKFHVYESGTLREVGQFELTDSKVRIVAEELFADPTDQ